MKEAADKATREAEEKATEEKRKSDDIIKAFNKAHEAAEKRAEDAKAQRVADENKAKNKVNRAKTKSEAVYHIKGIYGTTLEQAEGIFDAIAAGDVPHTKIIW